MLSASPRVLEDSSHFLCFLTCVFFAAFPEAQAAGAQEEHKLGVENKRAFVQMVLPLLQMAQFSKSTEMASSAEQSLKQLACASPPCLLLSMLPYNRIPSLVAVRCVCV